MKRLALGLTALLLLTTGAPPAGAAPAAPTIPGVQSTVSVSLITGDQVTIADGQEPTVTIAPGRRVTFQTTYVDGNVRVVPSDVAHLLGKVLDPQLFDVTTLARSGYHDSLPLIVQDAPSIRGKSVKELPSIRARAIELSTSETLTRFTGRIWLDAKVHSDAIVPEPDGRTRWDTNLTQIGAPSAWAAGLSGVGVHIAVLDTGVDASHPDLAGRVAAAENFTDSPFATDRHGHGTHVASIVAGSGAAAVGQRRGVAYAATLLSGKVLGDDGTGQFSDIIAGMEWAASNGAKVVNMSLGSDSPSNGQDPLSLAVDALTASHGTLFVTSAGNRGPRATTIGAPGAADSALTVGAVDRRDRLADFSSRGPRLGDYAIKPDLVAPGVDIIAARATGTELGEPVGRHYTRLSGTSMAAPHVAGAATLLAQHHPEWTAAKLKAALVGTANPMSAGSFEAGSGRLDLTSAVPQLLLAPASSLSFGFVGYPQAGLPPLHKPLVLANNGPRLMTVDLSADMKSLTVSPRRLAIPAGGTATATVTIAIAEGGFGPLAGTVTASHRDGPAVRVPVGVVKEVPHHLLHLRALDRLGTTQVETLAWVVNLGDITASPADPVLLRNGVATVRVPDGHYAVTAAIPTLEEGDPPPDSAGTSDLIVTSVSIATVAEVLVRQDTEVLLDARRARPVSAAVIGAETIPVDVHMFVAAKDRRKNGFVLAYATSAEDVLEHKLFVEPTTSARHGTLEMSSKWRLDSVDSGPTYDLLFAEPFFPVSMEYRVDPRDLGKVRTKYRIPASPVGYQEGRFVYTAVNPVSIAVFQPAPTAPARRVEYLSPGSSWQWFQCTNVSVGEEGIGGYCQSPAKYHRGSTADHGWMRAPLRTRAGAFRTNTQLFVGMDELADDEPNGGTISGHAFAQRSFALYRNGALIAEGVDPLGGHAIPAGPAIFRLTRSLELRPGLLALSTKVESSWTFTAKPDRDAPIVDIAVHVPVDDNNRVDGGSPVALEVEVDHPGGRVFAVSLELSTDDGQTWQRVTLRRHSGSRYAATVSLTEGSVSLRTAASDNAGNHTEQTVLRAFEVT